MLPILLLLSFVSHASPGDHPLVYEIRISPEVCGKIESGSASELYCREFVKNQEDPHFSRVYVPGLPEKYILIGDKKIKGYAKLVDSTFAMVGLGAGLIAVMRQMPEGITNWNNAELNKMGLAGAWQHHVGQPARWDNDSPLINYVGHPLSGAGYYLIARNSGLGPAESFVYSALMSTFYWEYGLEATAEIPSKTDLLVTPILGSAYGELAHMAREKIRSQDGKLFGSKVAGTVVSVLLNPVGEVAEGTRSLLAPLVDNLEVSAGMFPSVDPSEPSKFTVMFGLKITFNDFGFDRSYRYSHKRCQLDGEDMEARSAADLQKIYDKARAKGNYCEAARAMAQIQLRFPADVQKHQANELYLTALAEGGYFLTYINELAVAAQFQNTWAAVERRSFEILKLYERYLPEKCTNPLGFIYDKEKGRLPYRTEALMLTENFLVNFPASDRADAVMGIRSKIAQNLKGYEACAADPTSRIRR